MERIVSNITGCYWARARGVVVRGADFSSLRRAGAGSSLPSSSLSHLVFSSSFSLPVAPSRVLFSNFTRYDVITSPPCSTTIPARKRKKLRPGRFRRRLATRTLNSRQVRGGCISLWAQQQHHRASDRRPLVSGADEDVSC